MAIKAKARTPVPAAVEEDEDPTSVDVNASDVAGEGVGEGEEGTGEVGEAGAGAGARERGPFLRWNDARNAALARVVREAIDAGDSPSPRSVTEALASDPAFAGLAEGALVPAKIRLQVNRLRKAGVEFPPLASDRGGPSAYVPNISALNEILGG